MPAALVIMTCMVIGIADGDTLTGESREPFRMRHSGPEAALSLSHRYSDSVMRWSSSRRVARAGLMSPRGWSFGLMPGATACCG